MNDKLDLIDKINEIKDDAKAIMIACDEIKNADNAIEVISLLTQKILDDLDKIRIE